MSLHLTKYQKQGLGHALQRAGYAADAFSYFEEPDDDEEDGSVTLTNKATSDRFTIAPNGENYIIQKSVPGSSRYSKNVPVGWEDVVSIFESWAGEVKREQEAIDPWEQEAEDMASDDSYFRQDELPRVDQAIDDSLDELKRLAIKHGKTLKQIQTGLQETRQVLQKTARSSTKQEWLGIFKGIIVEKLVDWGLQTELFKSILQVLITSAREVAQLAEHATRYLS